MKGDFLGFSFGNIHSNTLGITHVSVSDRYEENLLPEFEDKIEPIIGNDGNYYFGSLYRTKGFTVSFAFDSMTEVQFRKMSQWLNAKIVGPLIFDERPYKVYIAKVSTPPQISYVCFDEPRKYIDEDNPIDGVRVIRENGGWEREKVYPYKYGGVARTYKGEGTVEFVCPYPFARQQFKMLDQYGEFETFINGFGEEFSYTPTTPPGNRITTYTNITEWAEASGILTRQEYERILLDSPQAADINGYNYIIPVYNPGDVASPFYLFLPYGNGENAELGYINPPEGDKEYIDINCYNEVLRLRPIVSKAKKSEENGVMINTRNHLIEGVVYDYGTGSWRTTGNIYNEYIEAGDFGKIKCQDWSLDYRDYSQSIAINCATGAGARIKYDYLYY